MQLDHRPGVGSIQGLSSFEGKGDWKICALILSLAVLLGGGSVEAAPSGRADMEEALGVWKAPLQDLARFYVPPGPGESTQLFDMWEGGKLAMYARAAGLTNYHALIIHSHGKTVHRGWKRRHALYPHESLVALGRAPLYAPEDFARYLGERTAGAIRVLMLGGCDRQGSLDVAEWRRVFPRAEVIIHAAEGENGYEPMFFQVLFRPGTEVKPLFEVMERDESGQRQFMILKEREKGSVRMNPYVADLFRDGEAEPYGRVKAGREMFERGRL